MYRQPKPLVDELPQLKGRRDLRIDACRGIACCIFLDHVQQHRKLANAAERTASARREVFLFISGEPAAGLWHKHGAGGLDRSD